jgi:hypothetical protein
MQAPDDRVLFLAIPAIPVIREMAGGLDRGLIVAIGSDDEVRAARRECADLENVLFVGATPDDIPWRSGFFTQVIDPKGEWADPEKVAREVARVSVPKSAH